MEKKVTFSQRLQELIDSAGITKTELSKKAGISKSSVTRYIQGDWEANQDTLYKIASGMNVSEAWLMGYDVPKEREKPIGEITDRLSDTGYYELNEKNRALVDALIHQLKDGQSSK